MWGFLSFAWAYVRYGERVRPHLPALTSVRFFAALHVIIVHFGLPTFSVGPWWLHEFAGRGSVGVSVFFTLSGFILAYTYAGRDAPMRQFWWARFARIYPVYLASLLFAAYAFRGSIAAFVERGGSLPWLLVKFATLTQGWTLDRIAIKDTTLLNNPTWSLSTEAFFYLVFPLLLLVMLRASFRTTLLLSLGMWATWVGVIWFLTAPEFRSAGMVPAWSSTELVYKHPLFRLHEFVVGIAFGLWLLREPKWRFNGRLAWLLVALLAVLLVSGRRLGVPNMVLVSGLVAPLVAALFVLLASGAGPARFLTGPVLVRLGEASYAIYVLHMPVGMYLVEVGMTNLSAAHFLATTVVTIGLSLLVYRFVEAPARRWLRRLPVGSRERPRVEARVSG